MRKMVQNIVSVDLGTGHTAYIISYLNYLFVVHILHEKNGAEYCPSVSRYRTCCSYHIWILQAISILLEQIMYIMDWKQEKLICDIFAYISRDSVHFQGNAYWPLACYKVLANFCHQHKFINIFFQFRHDLMLQTDSSVPAKYLRS